MKISKSQLRQMITEEVKKITEMQAGGPTVGDLIEITVYDDQYEPPTIMKMKPEDLGPDLDPVEPHERSVLIAKVIKVAPGSW